MYGTGILPVAVAVRLEVGTAVVRLIPVELCYSLAHAQNASVSLQTDGRPNKTDTSRNYIYKYRTRRIACDMCVPSPFMTIFGLVKTLTFDLLISVKIKEVYRCSQVNQNCIFGEVLPRD